MQHLYVEHNHERPDAVTYNDLRAGILRPLLYFDIFNYPLTIEELIRFSSVPFSGLGPVENILDELVESFIVFRFGQYYSLQNDATLVARRIKGNTFAADMMMRAHKKALLIHKFPFVRSVNISGSLSKNYYDETTDFDFFVIAETNRIWICRLLLTCYKKLFLLNRRKYFCINYYIDTSNFLIPDRNLFSAIEIITLKNQTGESIYKKFMETNGWVSGYLPNHVPNYSFLEKGMDGWIKIGMEKLLRGKLGDTFDNLAFKITRFFLKKKYKSLSSIEFRINMRSKKHTSKHHPQGFQFKVLKAFQEKCRDFENTHGIAIA
jgi:hypothetical protein